MKKLIFAGLSLLGFFIFRGCDASVMPLQERVLFLKDEKVKSLSVVSHEHDSPVLLQAWVDNGQPEGLTTSQNYPFVITPAIIKLKPMQVVNLRIMPTARAHDLPTDRESSYWINLYEVPGLVRDSPAAPVVEKIKIGLNSQLKLIYRPFDKALDAPALEGKIEVKTASDAPDRQNLWIINNSPYVLTPLSVTAENGEKSDQIRMGFDRNIMPYSERKFSSDKNIVGDGTPIRMTFSADDGKEFNLVVRANQTIR